MENQNDPEEISEKLGYPNEKPNESSAVKSYQLPKKGGKSATKPLVIPSVKDFGFLENTYRKHELIVIFKSNTPTDEEIKKVKKSFHELGIKQIRVIKCKCSGCNLQMQLWLAENIHTIVSGTVVSAGTSSLHTVGENYSLNFLSRIPLHNWHQANLNLSEFHPLGQDVHDEVMVAVLDTGVDRSIVNEGYIGNDLKNKCGECFSDSTKGWNFVGDNDDIDDDNPGRHGSLVTQFIINQFKNSKKNAVKIIPLKTHDRNGEGDLFNIFCAVQYAIAKGANIINASWGFYYYDTPLSEPLRLLIEELRDKGILLVTAAGNKMYNDDLIAEKLYYLLHGVRLSASKLRDLDIHQFLPACFSNKEKNLITVTTTDGNIVSDQENYSKHFVDTGVIADKNVNKDLLFEVPFALPGPKQYVGGSSFATAIATGVIGANCDVNAYGQNTIDKQSFIVDLLADDNLCQKHSPLNNLINDGIAIKKQH